MRYCGMHSKEAVEILFHDVCISKCKDYNCYGCEDIDSCDLKKARDTLLEDLDNYDLTIDCYDKALTKSSEFISNELGCCPDEKFNNKFDQCKCSNCDGNSIECWKNWSLYSNNRGK